ncbi:unnamed protein product [Camellia sinensis]
MSDYIPDEVLIEILARLPVKSLLQFRSVCKSWNSLIANPSFITTHLNQTKSNTQLLIIKYTHVPNQERFISCSDDETCCGNFVELENPFHSPGISFKIVGSCNGLLCISPHYGSEFAFLWKPSIRRFLTLPESGYSVTDSDLQFVFGFGFDRISNDYKVVKIGYLNEKTRGSVLCKMELYALSTLSWRPICVVDFRFELSINTWSVFVNEAVHWVAFDPAKEHGFGILIVAFDMGNEVFREISLPNYQPDGRLHTSTAVAVLGESLAVIDCASGLVAPSPLMYNFHIWVMEEYGVIESWTKRYTIIGQNVFSKVLGFRKNGDVLIDDDELLSYDPQSHQIKNLGVYGNSFNVYTYMESLVALDGADGVWESHEQVHPNSPDAIANKEA